MASGGNSPAGQESPKPSMKQWKKSSVWKDVIWEKTTLGPPAQWSPTLQVISALIMTFPHPAAIYWTSEKFNLLCNDSWFRLREGELQIGQPQTEKLTDAVLDTLRTVMVNNEVKLLETGTLFDHFPSDLHVLCSPIVETDVDRVGGVLCQLLPYKNPEEAVAKVEAAIRDPQGHGQTQDSKDRIKSAAELDSTKSVSKEASDMREDDAMTTLEELPLDEHPFFKRFASLLPTGIAILNREAEAIFVNEHFYELTTLSREEDDDHQDQERSFDLWPHTIHEDDYDKVMNLYHEAFTSKKPLRTEFRSKGPKEKWRLLLLSPLGDDNLHHASLRKFGGFICALVDITSNKMAEFRERTAAREARERKEQQERFIDMISHEIRNPLSAVLHCTEDIEEIARTQKGETRDEILEATDTIKLCVNHQRHIVDDILSFSKLDASMLSLNPRDSQPKQQLGETLKMFQPEFKKQKIQFEFKLDYSYRDLHIEWVKADLVRVSQILVNLITNAIKFTARKEGRRDISVAIGACIDRPTSYPPNVVFFDTDNAAYRLDGTLSSEWGQGQALYILCAVIDTGIGISEDSQKKLFERFRQATPKTEETYGGSGLGLNISRKLCHLHGGEIGVKSIEGKGSTFGFFFKVRRTETPTDKNGKEVMQSEEMKDEVAASSDTLQRHVSDSDIPESLSNPQYSKVREANLDEDKEDSEFEKTADIATKIDNTEEDVYQKNSKSPRNETKASPLSRSPSQSSSTSVHDDAGLKDPNQKRKSKREDTAPSTKRNESNQSVPKTDIAKPLPDKAPSTNFSPADAGKTRVLLVEDNVINAKILRRKLEARHFAVQVAVNGQEAVDAVQKYHPATAEHGAAHNYDVILMDQEMPVKDGLTAAREIRAWEKEQRESEVGKKSSDEDDDDGDDDVDATNNGNGRRFHLPILGVSANVRDEHRTRMEEAGIDDFLGKPYAIDEIVKKIGELLGSGNGSQEGR